MYGRMFFVALGLVGAIGTAAVYGVGAHLVITGAISIGTLVAMAAYVTRIYEPLTGLTNARVDMMTAMVCFERVFEVLDAPDAIQDRPGAVDLVEPGRADRARRRVVPLPGGADGLARLARGSPQGGGALSTDEPVGGAARRLARHRARPAGGAGRARRARARPRSPRSSPGSTT